MRGRRVRAMTKAGRETLCGCLLASVRGLIFTLLRGNDHQSRIPDADEWMVGPQSVFCNFGGISQNTAMNSLDQAEFSSEYLGVLSVQHREKTAVPKLL
jgi:hypothetical protein